MKLLSVVVPCYNAEKYMERSIPTILTGGTDVELIIVDDGSKDSTAEIADGYAEKYPEIVRVIHKENGGHGSAINSGLAAATGLFFKVVDADDRLEETAFAKVLDLLRQMRDTGETLDMLICNYVYDKEEAAGRKKVIHHRGTLPQNRIFSWEEAGHFKKGHYILMHAVIYRTECLRESGLKPPEKCFYVDNIYVFNPFPYVKRLYYLDVDLYYYFIGRSDQSVNEEIMIRRIDQQLRVTYEMLHYYTSEKTQAILRVNRHLDAYMYNYLEIIISVSSILALISNTPENLAKKQKLWDDIRQEDPKLYRRLRSGAFGFGLNIPGPVGRFICIAVYKAAQRIYNFN